MCGRFLFDGNIDDIITKYNLSDTLEVYYSGKPEIFPGDTFPVITNSGFNQLHMMKWGFTPQSGKGLVINARSETVEEKGMFKASFLYKRCVIPANAFFEWKTDEDGKKVKHKIYTKDQPLFSMAAIYNEFTDKTGMRFMAFTILTTDANEAMAEIHDRMPVILDTRGEGIWLDTQYSSVSSLKRILNPYESSNLCIITA